MITEKIDESSTKLQKLWGNNQQKAFNMLKEKLITAPILKYPDFDKPFIIMTDASRYAVGAVLGQEEEKNKDYVIAYASKMLKGAETRYSIIEKECYAIIYALKQFLPFIYVTEVTIRTDHKPLEGLWKNKDTSSRILKWAMKIQDMNIQIKYKSGRANRNADALSRIRNIREVETM